MSKDELQAFIAAIAAILLLAGGVVIFGTQNTKLEATLSQTEFKLGEAYAKLDETFDHNWDQSVKDGYLSVVYPVEENKTND